MRLVFALVLCCLSVPAALPYKAGVSRVDITPEGPIWMSGYANRNKPSEGVLHRLSAKALALEDGRGGRVVIVSTDLIGLPRAITDVVGAEVQKQWGLDRSHLLINSSHTHTGPLIRGNLKIMADLDEANQKVVDDYSTKLTGQLVTLIGAALSAMKPATVSYGQGTAGFAMNRRQKAAAGVKLGVNPAGPMDHSVPVLKIADADGKTVAVLFGYACHNTTLTGDHYKIGGDYSGFAATEIEAANPGSTALFIQLCAGDQNPEPRTKEVHVEQNGRALATEVQRVMAAKMDPVKGRLNGTLQWKELPVQPFTRDDFEKMAAEKNAVRVRFARAMLKSLDERKSLKTVPFPMQALRLGDNFVLVALGGEATVEYALKIKAAHPKNRLIVAAYSNDVMGYIPTAKIIEEGGYEPVGSTIYYGQAAPFSTDIEKIILDAADAAIRRVKP